MWRVLPGCVKSVWLAFTSGRTKLAFMLITAASGTCVNHIISIILNVKRYHQRLSFQDQDWSSQHSRIVLRNHLLPLNSLSGGNSSAKLLQSYNCLHFIKSGQSQSSKYWTKNCRRPSNWPCLWERPQQLYTGIQQKVSSFGPEQSDRRWSGPGCSSWTNFSWKWWLVDVRASWTKLRIGTFSGSGPEKTIWDFLVDLLSTFSLVWGVLVSWLTFSVWQRGRGFGWNTLCTVWSARPICQSSFVDYNYISIA